MQSIILFKNSRLFKLATTFLNEIDKLRKYMHEGWLLKIKIKET